jgi:hypothetical protein
MWGRCASKPGDAEIAGGEESEPASVPAGERGDTMDGRVKRREPEHTPKTHHVLSPSINAGASTVLCQGGVPLEGTGNSGSGFPGTAGIGFRSLAGLFALLCSVMLCYNAGTGSGDLKDTDKHMAKIPRRRKKMREMR